MSQAQKPCAYFMIGYDYSRGSSGSKYKSIYMVDGKMHVYYGYQHRSIKHVRTKRGHVMMFSHMYAVDRLIWNTFRLD